MIQPSYCYNYICCYYFYFYFLFFIIMTIIYSLISSFIDLIYCLQRTFGHGHIPFDAASHARMIMVELIQFARQYRIFMLSHTIRMSHSIFMLLENKNKIFISFFFFFFFLRISCRNAELYNIFFFFLFFFFSSVFFLLFFRFFLFVVCICNI